MAVPLTMEDLMLSHRIARAGLVACATIASLATPAGALALPCLRQQTHRDIDVITGGVGQREREALNNISNAYNLFVIMALETGAYLADVHVTLREQSGQVVLETTTRGPFLLADLPAGRYDVKASASGDRTESTTVDVVRGQQARTFLTFPRKQR
jgi:hypothetical protein